MQITSARFEQELNVFGSEVDVAVQYFYAWQSVNTVAGKDSRVLKRLNDAPLFWNTAIGALQTAALVGLGRIFDPDPQSHSVSRLLALAHGNLHLFSKSELAARKRSLSQNANDWLADYLSTVHEPTSADFRRLKRYVNARRRVYEAIYKPLRHKVFAHRQVASRADIASLFAKTDIRQLQQLLVFLRRLHEALWQLFHNGMKPVLRPARYSTDRMLAKPSPGSRGQHLQERLTLEAGTFLRSISGDAQPFAPPDVRQPATPSGARR